MKYLVKRFSSLLNDGLDGIDDLTGRIIENPNLKDIRPVKRYGRLTRSIVRLLKRKKSEEKKYSLSSSQTKDPTTSLNISEANKFRVSLNRLTNSMSTDTQSLVD